ncbi:MAG: histidine kinase dimerization/phospho-acceptor domain-containing protein [Chloroflexota bacterium]
MQSPANPITDSQLTVELETYLGEMLFDKLRLVEERDEVIAQAVHDLRGPITNIKLYIYLLERADPEQQTRYVAVLKECVAELADMTGNLMEHIQAGKPMTNPIPETSLH